LSLAIGSVIGHEITHGFDDTRRHLDKDRKNDTLWSNETTKTYNKRSKCLIDQYNNYLVKQINRTVRHKNDTFSQDMIFFPYFTRSMVHKQSMKILRIMMD